MPLIDHERDGLCRGSYVLVGPLNARNSRVVEVEGGVCVFVDFEHQLAFAGDRGAETAHSAHGNSLLVVNSAPSTVCVTPSTGSAIPLPKS